MIEDMQLRHLTAETQRTYLHHITGLARFYQYSAESLNQPQPVRLLRQVPLQRHPGSALRYRRVAAPECPAGHTVGDPQFPNPPNKTPIKNQHCGAV
jgi:hypothetical protein